IPAGDLIVVGGCGLILSPGVLLRLPGFRSAATYALCFLSVLIVGLTFRGLTTITYILTAAGVTSQLARLALARAQLFRRLVRRSLPVLGAILIALFGIEIGREIISEAHALAALPLPRPEAPNVLFIVLDTVRAESLGLYGYARDTS